MEDSKMGPHWHRAASLHAQVLEKAAACAAEKKGIRGIPEEVLNECVLQRLSLKDQICFASTCCAFYGSAGNAFLWESMVRARVPGLNELRGLPAIPEVPFSLLHSFLSFEP